MNNEFKKVNDLIDEEKVRNTNNRIKVEKDNPALRIIVLLISLIILVCASFLVFNLSKKYVEGNKEEVTTTSVNKNKLYLLNTNSVRKLENESTIIYLIDDSTYITLNKELENSVFIKGTYKIEDDKIIINNISYDITDNGITSDNISIKTFDSEYKYYRNGNDILLVNATPKKELFVTIKNNEITNNKYTETKDAITLDDNTVYEKVETTLVNNNIIYNIGH